MLWKLFPLMGRLNQCKVVFRVIRAPRIFAKAFVMQLTSLPESAQISSTNLLLRSIGRCLFLARACRVVSFVSDNILVGVGSALQAEQLPMQSALPQLDWLRSDDSDLQLSPPLAGLSI